MYSWYYILSGLLVFITGGKVPLGKKRVSTVHYTSYPRSIWGKKMHFTTYGRCRQDQLEGKVEEPFDLDLKFKGGLKFRLFKKNNWFLLLLFSCIFQLPGFVFACLNKTMFDGYGRKS